MSRLQLLEGGIKGNKFMHQHIPPSSQVIPPPLLSVIHVSRRLRTEKMRELWGCWDGKRKVNELHVWNWKKPITKISHNYPPSAVPPLPILTFELIVHFRFWFWGADNSHHTHISIIIVTLFLCFFPPFSVFVFVSFGGLILWHFFVFIICVLCCAGGRSPQLQMSQQFAGRTRATTQKEEAEERTEKCRWWWWGKVCVLTFTYWLWFRLLVVCLLTAVAVG